VKCHRLESQNRFTRLVDRLDLVLETLRGNYRAEVAIAVYDDCHAACNSCSTDAGSEVDVQTRAVQGMATASKHQFIFIFSVALVKAGTGFTAFVEPAVALVEPFVLAEAVAFIEALELPGAIDPRTT
jgi:hypothetical protein